MEADKKVAKTMAWLYWFQNDYPYPSANIIDMQIW